MKRAHLLTKFRGSVVFYIPCYDKNGNIIRNRGNIIEAIAKKLTELYGGCTVITAGNTGYWMNSSTNTICCETIDIIKTSTELETIDINKLLEPLLGLLEQLNQDTYYMELDYNGYYFQVNG